MRHLAAWLSSFFLAIATSMLLPGCASAPPMPAPDDLLHDELFAAPPAPIDPDEALALSVPMRDFLAARLARAPAGLDRRRWLIEALYRRQDLRLEYDATLTRTAAQAFEARAGNCLALVMMTGALARAMGLRVQYQAAVGADSFEQAGDLAISIGHVNLTLDDRARHAGSLTTDRGEWTVDFLPSLDAARLRTRPIGERTVIAMYLNNRAVETLLLGQVDAAYGWAREAIRRDPELLAAYLTLGVVYRTRHLPALAEATLARVNQREPDNTQALANRVLALRDMGRDHEAEALQQRLDRLDPHPRFGDFRLGPMALRDRATYAAKLERLEALRTSGRGSPDIEPIDHGPMNRGPIEVRPKEVRPIGRRPIDRHPIERQPTDTEATGAR